MTMRQNGCAMAMLSGLLATMLLAGCSPSAAPAVADRQPSVGIGEDALVQYSLIAALADGDYEGGVSLRELLTGGDFGIGTFERLDGEMIVLGGEIFQGRADGTVRRCGLDEKTPFAAVTQFQEDGRLEKLNAATLEDLDSQLDRKLAHRNTPYALRIDGEFAEVTIRSVPAQTPPYKPLVEVVKNQPTWNHQKVRGTMLGFRCPSWVGTLNVAGYHWHFLSDDRKIGGHVLNCRFTESLLRYDECTALLIRVPQSERFDQFTTDKIKREDINEIERKRDK